MHRSVLSRLLMLLGASGVTMACNAGGEVITNPIPDTEIEPNDTADTATPLGPESFGQTEGFCESAGALDHYRLATGTAGTATASESADPGVLGSVALLASNGALLAETTAAPFDASANVSSAGGAVVLRITCAATGEYSGQLIEE